MKTGRILRERRILMVRDADYLAETRRQPLGPFDCMEVERKVPVYEISRAAARQLR